MAMRMLLLALISISGGLYAQKKTATVSGRISDSNNNPLSGASVTILGRATGTLTNDSGFFQMAVPSDKAFALVFSYAGYQEQQINFNLRAGTLQQLRIQLRKTDGALKEVLITAPNDRREVGLVSLDPKSVRNLPSVTGGIEALIKVFVGSNNELTSQYSVRGGNYDENLVYVNDFEVFRPYLVRSGQQEGLSFINPELTGRIQFYNGGFQAKFGDRMSSVLDIAYRKPTRLAGSAYLGILEQGIHLEGTDKRQRFSYLIGGRSRTNRSILAAQEVKGSYIPSSADVQALCNAQLHEKWEAEALINISRTSFEFLPSDAQLTSSVFSPFFSANLGMDVYYEGREIDAYNTSMAGISATYRPRPQVKLKWLASHFLNREQESFDITGYYVFGDREFDRSKPDFGEIVNPLGVGGYQRYGRNRLQLQNLNIGHRGEWTATGHHVLWGIGLDRTIIQDRLNEWERKDSTGYTIPYDSGKLLLTDVIKSNASLELYRISGFLQDNMIISKDKSFTLQAGMRFQYNSLNQQWLISPRLSASKLSGRKKDLIWKAALGAYHQPPFYRELRKPDGSLNTNLRAQRSWQAVAGADLLFRWQQRPFRLTGEAYIKSMSDVVTYDIDNVRIRYSGINNAKAYAAGLELRLAGEWVKDAESWISLGLMRTMEDLSGDSYIQYLDKDGKPFSMLSADPLPADSIVVQKGWVRRPTDRLFTLGMFFQDYLSTNKNIRVHLNLLVGSNMPYNLPGSVKYRNALVIDPYIRADIGFSALLYDAEKTRRKSFIPGMKSCWISLELFNLLDRRNTISYQFIKDFSNTFFTMPNRLTPRLLGFKTLVRF